MSNPVLYRFIREDTQLISPDFWEQFGNISLGLLRTAFGQTVTVRSLTHSVAQFDFTPTTTSTLDKVCAVAGFILILPLSVTGSILGYLAMKGSRSYQKMAAAYHTSRRLNVANSVTPQQVSEMQITQTETPTQIQPCVAVHSMVNSAIAQEAREAEIEEETKFQIPYRLLELKETHLTACGELTKKGVYPMEDKTLMIRWLGERKAKKSLDTMKKVAEKLAEQKSLWLYVPAANCSGNCLIEEDLSVVSTNGPAFFYKTDQGLLYSMSTYALHPERFNDAVRELFLFGLQAHLPLGSDDPHPIAEGDNIFYRYDHFFMYIDKRGKGRIGLTCADQISFDPEKDDSQLLKFVRFFPYHLNLIKETAKRSNISFEETTFDIAAEKGRKYLEGSIFSHRDWLNQKKLTNHLEIFTLSVEREQELTTFCQNNLPENEQMSASNILTTIINGIKSAIQEKQQRQLTQLSRNSSFSVNTMSIAGQISFRSIMIQPPWYQGAEKLKTSDWDALLRESGDSPNRSVVSQFPSQPGAKLSCLVLDELVKGGEIFRVDHTQYPKSKKIWIRY
jgi:hypothetical protein